MKKIPHILIKIFIIIFIIQLISVVFLLLTPEESKGGEIQFKPQVTISEKFKKGATPDVTPNTIGEYISAIYKYATGIVGILAAVVLMVGGVMWITAAGNQTRVGEAKAWITAALTGLVIAMASFMILYTVNPELTKFRPIAPKPINRGATGSWDVGSGAPCTSSGDCDGLTCILSYSINKCSDGTLGSPCADNNFCLDSNCPMSISECNGVGTINGVCDCTD